ncbi:helix-turn-helix protein [Tumebacillus sp. BK434]|uniref:helix-turn-helix domain-containing protein n=1 Tax=Tumebacillus sp. BK434 TaxID=2512169 RepID=UPI00104B769C|nr:helix-turn-helix transcriptional regulator [Tumebacillus sp. BK434]TCP59019.1 helix-turn-helix protein [Tumebacillus sp. BK434]
MIKLVILTNAVVDKIPLWLRIREIMKERGSSYSLTAVSARLGISRETLRLMLSGEREIHTFELKTIAEDL